MLNLQGCWGRCRDWTCGSAGLRVCGSLCSQGKSVKTDPGFPPGFVTGHVGPTGMCVCFTHTNGSKRLDEHTQATGSAPAVSSHQVVLLPISRRRVSCVALTSAAAPGPARPRLPVFLSHSVAFRFSSFTQQFNSPPKHFPVQHVGKFRNC